MGRRIAVLIVIVGLTVALWASASAAKTKDPCKTLKTSEIATAFGGATVAKGTKSSTSPITPQCEWAVSASANLPEGSVFVFVQSVGGKAAYNAHKNEPTNYQPVTGVKNALYYAAGPAVEVLKGKNLLNVQGVFLATGPITAVDVKDQLVELAKKAVKRI